MEEDPLMTFKEKLNSRKLALTGVVFSINTALLLTNSIQADHWVTVTITLCGAYLATQAYVDKQ